MARLWSAAGSPSGFPLAETYPAAPTPVQSPIKTLETNELIPKKGTVYVVDDDEAVRDLRNGCSKARVYRVRCV